ncbi:MAG: hypothetical protein ABWY11_22620 [Umezawaea sp.]
MGPRPLPRGRTEGDQDGTTECDAPSLRQSVGTDTDDDRFVELVGELSLVSPRFRALWNRHDVGNQRGAPVPFDHPRVGQLRLHRERLAISGTGGQADPRAPASGT